MVRDHDKVLACLRTKSAEELSSKLTSLHINLMMQVRLLTTYSFHSFKSSKFKRVFTSGSMPLLCRFDRSLSLCSFIKFVSWVTRALMISPLVASRISALKEKKNERISILFPFFSRLFKILL